MKQAVSAIKQNSARLSPLQARKLKKTVFVWMMLSLAIINFTVFWLYVNFDSILIAFQKADTGRFSLENFARMFREMGQPSSSLKGAVLNSFYYFFAGIFITFPLSLVFSYFLYKKLPFSSFFRVIFFLPSIISSVVLVTLFKHIVAVNGPIHELLNLLSGKEIDYPVLLADPRYAVPTIILYGIWTGFGLNIVLFTGAMFRIPEDIVEYDALEGVGFARELFAVFTPMIWPTITTMIVYSTAGIFTNMANILVFTNGNFDTQTVAFFIFAQVKYASAYNYPAAIGVFFSALGVPLVLGVKGVLERLFDTVTY